MAYKPVALINKKSVELGGTEKEVAGGKEHVKQILSSFQTEKHTNTWNFLLCILYKQPTTNIFHWCIHMQSTAPVAVNC